ncbi:MmgE/PrpD family protein [Verticiella sediminum]|nr:MmgE/PrpD family protein [Verticiella sediminum]
MSTLEALSALACNLRWQDCDAQVQQRVRWIVADTVAAMVGGSAEPEMRALSAARAVTGRCMMLGIGTGADAESAAMVNGSAGTFLELDEGNRFARGHAGVHVIPAALAACETSGADADTFLVAVLAGYEVCSRIAAHSRLRDGVHPHGTWGTLGAAVAAGRIAGIGPQPMARLIGIASSLMTATSKRTMLEGGLVRNVYAGLANRNGLLALQLLQAGFDSELDGLRSLFGAVLSERFDEAALLASLPQGDPHGPGTQWHVMHNYFKLHACCRYNHGVLDALDLLAAQQLLPAADEVERIEVTTYDLAAELSDPAPRNTLAAKFSVPFAVATRLVHGNSGVRSFGWEAVRDPRVRSLATRVQLHEDAAMTRSLPQERPARVVLHLRNGATRTAETSFNRGDEASPYTDSELTFKFTDLCMRAWPRTHAERVLVATLALGREVAMADWLRLLRHPPTD